MHMDRIAPHAANMTPQERIAAAEAAQKAAQEAAAEAAKKEQEALEELASAQASLSALNEQQGGEESVKEATIPTPDSQMITEEEARQTMSVAQQRIAAMEAARAAKEASQSSGGVGIAKPAQESSMKLAEPSAPMSVAQQRIAAMEAARAARGESSGSSSVTTKEEPAKKEQPKKKGFGFKLKF